MGAMFPRTVTPASTMVATMVVVVIVLSVVAVAAVTLAVGARARLTQQRAEASEAHSRVETLMAESASMSAALADASDQLGTQRDLVEAERARAEESERRAVGQSSVDADVLWALEQARSERTWRFSVAPGPDARSPLLATTLENLAGNLVEALRVELEAAREDVGAVVELDAEPPVGITAAGAVLALRWAQELLADVVRRSESTTLRVRSEGDDLIVVIESVDEDGIAVAPSPLVVPAADAVEAIDGGVRLRHVISGPPDTADDANDDEREHNDGDPSGTGDGPSLERDVPDDSVVPIDEGDPA